MPHARSSSLGTALLVAAAVAFPAPACGQVLETVGGAVLGTAAGGVVSMAVVVGNARAGHYLQGPGEARWEILPIPAAAVAGGILGHRNPDRLWRTVGWGAGGLVVGAAAGALAGRILWGPSEGTWSGTVLGGATGMLAGALVGAFTWDGEDPAPVQLQLSVPFGP